MRKIVMLSLCAFAAAATPALANQLDGKIGAVDRSSKAFALGMSSSMYKTTPRTMILMGSTPTSFAAVKAGVPVQIDYHVEGSASIADRIVIK